MINDTIPTREIALDLLRKYNKSESLIKHALAVEGVMRYMAKKSGEDENKWGIIGLIHDLDYEMYPDQHCTMAKKILIVEDEILVGMMLKKRILDCWLHLQLLQVVKNQIQWLKA